MTSALPLSGRVALVAGGSGALGSSVARGLAAAGAAVAVQYRGNREAAEAVASACDGAIAVRAELTDPDAVERLFAEVSDRLGPPTVLVNAAHPGGPEATPVAELTPAALEVHLDGLRAYHLLCRGVLPGMRAAGFGRIVFVAGALMARPVPGLAAYGASKAAATTFTRFIALEEGRHGITANVVAPGRIVHEDEPEPEDPALRALAAKLLERMAFDHWPTYDEVAATIVSLTLPALSPLTGQTLWPTGGEPIG
jgi:NAD(P)-dependent dehydrogenase (short-subunit alcohol dehydrogenase family)